MRAIDSRRAASRMLVCALLLLPHASPAMADDVGFNAGSLIIPMDIDYQNTGMLQAFGLVDRLLRAGIPVSRCILPGKILYTAATTFPASPGNSVDFTVSATDFLTGASIASHGYRGGPFVIDAGQASAASPLITAWQIAHPATAVHVAAQPFTAPVRLLLTASPRIAVVATGNENIVFAYLNAAGVLDENGATWSGTSPGIFTPAAVSGPTTTDHTDGALFRPSRLPAYCALAAPHWAVTDPEVPESSAEIAAFLAFPVHLTAECTAISAIEGEPPTDGRQHLLTTQGLITSTQPAAVVLGDADLPFAQQDGPFSTVGGAWPSFGMASGSAFWDSQAVQVRSSTQAGSGVQDIVATGYAGGTCPIASIGNCVSPGPKGTVTYVGGHQYTTTVPMNANPRSQGSRLFLESLYAGGCVTAEGQPHLTVTVTAPAITVQPVVRLTLGVVNDGKGPAWSVTLDDTLPAGTTFVSASDGGAPTGNTVHWSLGDIPAGAPPRAVTLDVGLPGFGSYQDLARADLEVGLTPRQFTSNTATTTYVTPGVVPDGQAVAGSPLLVRRWTQGQIRLDWSPSCRGAGLDYAVYEGVIGAYYSHAPRICSTSGAVAAVFIPPPWSAYYLVVPRSSEYEGGYGVNSSGGPIPTGAGACLPGVAASCP